MPYREGDTIVAAATPPGIGALAVVRLSGPGSIALAEAVFRGRTPVSEAPARTLLHGEVIGADGEGIDEVLLASFRAPHSFTGEDSVEISCHGGPYLVRRILARIVEAGARLAEPGEFTRRAFRNGRLDLAQAEAVADLVRARTEAAARSALAQLRGALSARTRAARETLLDLLANVEADLDFASEEDVPRYDAREAARLVASAAEELEKLAGEGENGRLLREGVRTVIVGRPNSGKSTLFNALLGEERAIVSDEPGTTRDFLEGEADIGGLLFRLEDTAGVREGAEGVEGEGIRRSWKRQEEADLLLVTIDGSEPLTDEDRRILQATAGKKRIVVLTKGDLGGAHRLPPAEADGAVSVSAMTGEGIDRLRERMRRETAERAEGAGGDAVATSVRQIEALKEAAAAARRASGVVETAELFADDLRAAIGHLGAITGEGAADEVLDRIFARFCIGK
jgi:tRNA modification GTPase